MRDLHKLLLVGAVAAAFPVMAATGLIGGGSFVDPVSPTAQCEWEGDGCVIVVTGQPFPPTTGGGGFPGGGGGGTCEDLTPGLVAQSCQTLLPPVIRDPNQAAPTPCVEAAPAIGSLQEINDLAKKLGSDIEGLNMAVEWGSMIYSLNGQIGSTPLVEGTTDFIDWNKALAHVPTGALILATLHHHPDEQNINDAIPSYTSRVERVEGSDWSAYDSILSVQHRQITADPSLLMYIHTDERDQRGTWVYDRTDRNTRTVSCKL